MLERVLRDPARIDALRRSGLLGSPPEETFDRVVRLASLSLRSRVALISLVDVDRQFFKSSVGLREPWASRRETPLSHSICQHVVLTGSELAIEDTRADVRVRNSPAVHELEAISYAGTPVRSPDGHVLGAVAVLSPDPRRWTDQEMQILKELAGIVSAEIARRGAQKALQSQKMEALGRLAGGVAHDFNNLLTAILGSAEMILADSEGQKHEDAGNIRAAALRASELTRQLLAFSRQQVLKPQLIRVGEVVGEAVKLLRRVIGEDVELRTRVTQGAGSVRADVGQLTQVILNLAVNARDAMPHGGAIAIEVANEDVRAASAGDGPPPGEWVRLTVEDAGTGIDAETRKHLFEPFFTRKETGTGLGLATVHGVVLQSGGHIKVESEVGRGSRFHVLLPRVEAAPAVEGEPAAAAPAKGETVLVAEDDMLVRLAVRRALEASGYRVLVAGSGDEALRLLAAETRDLDVLLTDVIMPGMGGVELAQHVTGKQPRARVIFMTGYLDASRTELPGDAFFISKPFTQQSLAAKVREALNGNGCAPASPAARPGSSA